MKSLIVLRHAKSNWDANYDGDINRPITDSARQRARSTGAMLQTRGIDIDYALVEAHTTYGRLGVKVWIMKGEVYGKRELSPLVGLSKQKGKGGRGGNKGNQRRRK